MRLRFLSARFIFFCSIILCCTFSVPSPADMGIEGGYGGMTSSDKASRAVGTLKFGRGFKSSPWHTYLNIFNTWSQDSSTSTASEFTDNEIGAYLEFQYVTKSNVGFSFLTGMVARSRTFELSSSEEINIDGDFSFSPGFKISKIYSHTPSQLGIEIALHSYYHAGVKKTKLHNGTQFTLNAPDDALVYVSISFMFFNAGFIPVRRQRKRAWRAN